MGQLDLYKALLLESSVRSQPRFSRQIPASAAQGLRRLPGIRRVTFLPDRLGHNWPHSVFIKTAWSPVLSLTAESPRWRGYRNCWCQVQFSQIEGEENDPGGHVQPVSCGPRREDSGMCLFAGILPGADLHVCLYTAPFLWGNDFTRATMEGHWKFELHRDGIKFSLSGSLHWDLVNVPLWSLPDPPTTLPVPLRCSSLFPTRLHDGLAHLLPGRSQSFPRGLDYHLVKRTCAEINPSSPCMAFL